MKKQKQIITVTAEGEISGLQVKPGKGLDLRKLGTAKIERASEILFCELSQRWYVLITKGRFKNHILSRRLLEQTGVNAGIFSPNAVGALSSFMYDDYDSAVLDEIAFLDAVRQINHAWLE